MRVSRATGPAFQQHVAFLAQRRRLLPLKADTIRTCPVRTRGLPDSQRKRTLQTCVQPMPHPPRAPDRGACTCPPTAHAQVLATAQTVNRW